jgi:hypothetical protein
MSTPLPDDIVERIRHDFAPHEADEVIRSLSDPRHSAREARCLLVISNGSIDEFRKWLEIADSDNRDVFMKGECDASHRRVRHLDASFLIDAPDKFWIARIATILNSRGFRLVDVQSRVSRQATNQGRVPSDYEGIATFVGDAGTIRICLEDRKWIVMDESADLGVYGLDQPSPDSTWFHDAVSRFAAMKARGLHVRHDPV